MGDDRPSGKDAVKDATLRKMDKVVGNPAQHYPQTTGLEKSKGSSPSPMDADPKTDNSRPDPNRGPTGLLESAQGHRGRDEDGKTLREKAMDKLNGKNGNPSMLGDPTSIKNESTEDIPREAEEAGMGRKGSKL